MPPEKTVTPDAVVGVLEEIDKPFGTTADLADGLGVTAQTIRNNAGSLESDSRIRKGSVSHSTVYWLKSGGMDGGPPANGDPPEFSRPEPAPRPEVPGPELETQAPAKEEPPDGEGPDLFDASLNRLASRWTVTLGAFVLMFGGLLLIAAANVQPPFLIQFFSTLSAVTMGAAFGLWLVAAVAWHVKKRPFRGLLTGRTEVVIDDE